jgi:hypothetical protein
MNALQRSLESQSFTCTAHLVRFLGTAETGGPTRLAVSPTAHRRAARAAGKKVLPPGRRLVGAYWAMPGERQLWAADAHAFDDVGGIKQIMTPIKTTRKRAIKRRPR